MEARFKLSVELKREVERGSTFTFTTFHTLPLLFLFANVNFTHVRTLKLRDSGLIHPYTDTLFSITDS